MAYVTGTAASITDLLTAIHNACTANGYTLSGNVLSKGAMYTSLSVSGSDLLIQGGTGIDGSNNLTTPGPASGRVGATHQPLPMTFPATYNIHINTSPDEVYVWVNFGVVNWQWLAFGITPAPGLAGTGGWYAATSSSQISQSLIGLSPTIAGDAYDYLASGALFAQNSGYYSNIANSYIHHGLDGADWSPTSGAYAGYVGSVDAWAALTPLIGRQPNTWNGEPTLLAVQAYLARASSKVSLVADLGHARYMRNDNYADGDIITLGSDRWRVYPWAKKDADSRDGGNSIAHSGTFAIALRYDGP